MLLSTSFGQHPFICQCHLFDFCYWDWFFYRRSVFRYSIVFAYLGFNLVFLLSARPLLVLKFHERDNTNSLYDALEFLPVVAVIHAVCSGLICKYLHCKLYAHNSSSSYMLSNSTLNSLRIMQQVFHFQTPTHLLHTASSVAAKHTYFSISSSKCVVLQQKRL